MSISYKQLKSKLRFVNKRQKREKPMTLEQIHKEYEEELNQSEEEYMVARLEMRKRKTEEAARRAMQENEDVEQHHLRMLQIAANEVNDFVDDYSGSFVEVDDSMTQQVTDHVQKWAEYSEKAKEWYLESFALNGEPDLSKKSEVFEASPCSCGQRGIVKMTLYFLNAIQEIEIEHCKCNPLIKQLLLKQMMPNKTKSPRRAVHFAMLDYLHLLKMNGQISNHCFVDVSNQHYRKTELSLRVALLSNDILNSVYFLYRKLVRYARDEVTIKYGLESVDTCLGCENAERKLVTMDGNHQLKRLKKINRKEVSEEGLFALSSGEESLWGTKAEVDQMDSQMKEARGDCFLDPIEDSVFKAGSENNRNTSSGRYDENGVFSLSCARHGIPERLLNIHGGEGHKYALACVKHLLQQQEKNGPRQYGIMYDIICHVKNNLEFNFPYLAMNDTWYAVTAFHAYAHTMSCQVKYNPRYIPNFGYTDGEGCERFWSYLDGFVSMTRSMSARNRMLVITDAVDHFAYNKMLELPKQIKQKKEKHQKQLKIYKSQLEKVDTKKTIEEWQKTQDLLTTKITKKFVKKLYENTEKNIISSKPFLEYLAAKKVLLYLEKIENPDKIGRKKTEKLQQNVACFEAFSSSESSFRPVLDLEDERIAHLVTNINNQVTDFYITLVKTYIFALAFKERQLSGSGKIGSKKAGKLVLSIKQLASSAKNVIRLLNEHLHANCSQEEIEINKLDNLEAAIKKFPKESSLALSEDVLAWHKLCRVQEELQLLKDEEKRYVDNLDRKIYFVELAMEQAKPEHVVLIQEQMRKLVLLKKTASVFLDMPVSSPLLPSFPSTDEVSLSDAITNESDDIVDGGEIISTEDKEDELAPLVSILE